MTILIMSKARLQQDKPVMEAKNVDLSKRVKTFGGGGGNIIGEFIGNDNFAKQFYQRQKYV
jgi:hypothetical protein